MVQIYNACMVTVQQLVFLDWNSIDKLSFLSYYNDTRS